MTKTIQQVIEDLFVGKLVRFPGLSQQFQREQTHRILKVDISGTGDGMDGEAPPFSEVEVVFLTKTEGQGDKESTVVCVEPSDGIEFIDVSVVVKAQQSDWKEKYDCYNKTCAYPGEGKEYRCNDEAGLGFPSRCPCRCHRGS